MAGIKISELPRWTLGEVSSIDTDSILIPVSINANTGALLASVLIEILATKAPEHYMTEVNSKIVALTGTVESLQEVVNELISQNADLLEEIRILKEEQAAVDATQTSAISENSASIVDINVVNTLQDDAINALKNMHNWENYNDEDQGTEQPAQPQDNNGTPGEQTEP